MKRSLGFVYAAFCFRYVYPLVLVPFLARKLGAQEYGRVLAATSVTMLVWCAIEFGFPVCGARDVASAKDQRELTDVFSRHLSGRVLTLLPALLLGVVATVSTPVLRERPMLGALATLGGLSAGMNLGWFFQGSLRFVTSVVLEVLGPVVNLPLVLWLVRDQDDGTTVLALNLFSGLVVSVIGYAVALRSLERRALKLGGGVALIREATPLFANRGFGMLLQSGGIYIVSLFTGAQGVGWYGSAEKLVGLGISAMTPAGQVLVGTITKRLAEGGDGVFLLVRKAMATMFALAIVGAIAGNLLSSTLVPIALGPGYEQAVPLVKTLAWMLPLAALNQSMVTYVLLPLRLDRVILISSVVNALITLSIMVGVIDGFGLQGVCWARVLGELGVTAFLVVVLYRLEVRKAMSGHARQVPIAAVQQ